MAGNHLHDLGTIIADLEAQGRLARMRSEVDLRHELAGICYRLEGGPRAVLFEKVKGHRWPVFAGLYWNRGLLGALMRQDERTLPQFVSGCISKWQRDPVDPIVVKSGPVLEVTEREVDLGKIPVPVHALKDGGPYFDAPVVIAKDPETGIRNASIQRFQVVNRDTLHVNIDAGRHLEVYLEKAKRLGRSLWITLNCGVGPGLHFAAAAPAEAAPIDRDELGIASEFQGAPLELVPGTESDVEMVAHAMWALECEMIPGEVAPEGPFAEVTNYYAKVEPRPVVHVRRIHRRHAPVFQTILSGVEVWNSVGLLGEANVLALLQRQVPGVRDVYFSHGGGGFYHAVVQIDQKRAGWSKQAILAAFAAFPPLKMVSVVDEDVDIRNAQDVEWAMATRLDPRTGIVVIENAFGHGLNPSFPNYLGPKVGFDATQPFPKRPEYERVSFRSVSLDAYDIVQPEVKIVARAAAIEEREAAEAQQAALSSSDFDVDRVWRRELAEWTKTRGLSEEEGTPAPVKPPVSEDWDESRWWKRELEEIKSQRATKAGAPDRSSKKSAAGKATPSQAGPHGSESGSPRGASSDWDENRWWKRELEEMRRERDAGGKAASPAKLPRAAAQGRTGAISRPSEARATEGRAVEARSGDGRPAEDDEGGFFRGGAM